MSLENQPSNTPNPEKTAPSLSELYRPPRVKGRAKVDALLESGRPEDFEEIGRLLYQTESRQLLSYVGTRLGAELSPKHIGLACDLMRLRTFHGISDFLSILAQREFAANANSQEPLLAGPEYRELRQLIAEVAVGPEFAFSDRDYRRYTNDISNLTHFPITILRRVAGSEVDAVLVHAVTRGGLCVDTNRRGVELLTLRESSSPDRVLNDEAMISIARVLHDPLRDPFTRVLFVALIDRWLSKQQATFSPGDIAIREQLHAAWVEYSARPFELTGVESLQALDTIRLLRHFDDPITGLVLTQASLHAHPTISLVAKFIDPAQRREAFAVLESQLLGNVPPDIKLHAIRVFGHPISAEVDQELWPLFDRYVTDAWTLSNSSDSDAEEVAAARVIVLQSTLRRFFSEPVTGPFLSRLFHSFGKQNPPMSTVAVNTLTQVASLGQIPLLSFYEDFSNMGPVFESARILSDAVERDPANKAAHGLLRQLEEIFVRQGPASYGFEVEFNYRREEE